MILIQAIGRVRPHRQDMGKVIVLNTGMRQPKENEKATTTLSSLLKMEVDEQESLLALFTTEKFVQYLQQRDQKCLMVTLYKNLGIQISKDCGRCTYCVENNPIMRGKKRALEAVLIENESEKKIHTFVSALKERCIICRRSSCDGTTCVPQKEYYCFACGGPFRGNEWHKTKECFLRQREMNWIRLQGYCCRCYLVHGYAEGVNVLSHQTGECEGIKDRLKRCIFVYIQESPDSKISSIQGKREKVRDFFHCMYADIDSWKKEMIQIIHFVEQRQNK